MKELIVTTLPDRRRPILCVREAGGATWRILAYFKSKEAAAEFLAMTTGGLEWEKERKR
jgi:hypothetical protein